MQCQIKKTMFNLRQITIMTIGELKKKLKGLNDNAEVLVEEKINGGEFTFEDLAGMYVSKGNLVIYML